MINEIRAISEKEIYNLTLTIRFCYDIPNYLGIFTNPREILLKEILYGRFKNESIPNEGSQIKALYGRLEKDFIKGFEIVDYSEKDTMTLDFLPIKCFKESGLVGIIINSPINYDLRVELPRGASTFISNCKFEESKITLMNTFDTYGTEGFKVVLSNDDEDICIQAELFGSQKGKGDIFIYIKKEGFIYRDRLSKYTDVSPLLERFKG